jgi:hypothetical protein
MICCVINEVWEYFGKIVISIALNMFYVKNEAIACAIIKACNKYEKPHMSLGTLIYYSGVWEG